MTDSALPLDPKAYLKLARSLDYLDDAGVRELAQAYSNDPSRSIDDHAATLDVLDVDQRRDLQVLLGRPAQLGPYELSSVLGRGSMGIVYRARHSDRDAEVALKIPSRAALASKEAIEQHHEEGYLLQQLNHENIVRFVDAGEEGETLFLAMEFAEGPTVKEEIDRQGALEERRAMEVARQVASAMAHYHARGFVHRDLKPANMILTADDQVRILDLGVGKQAYLHGDSGERSGTPHYMSPEQIRRTADTEDLDRVIQTDLYSLGATLFHMLTGKPPYPGSSVREIMEGHLKSPVPNGRRLCPGSSPHTWEIVERLLAKRREQRYEQPFQVVEDLEAWLEDRPPEHARNVGRVVEASTDVTQRAWTPWVIGAVILAVALVGTGVFLNQPKDDDPNDSDSVAKTDAPSDESEASDPASNPDVRAEEPADAIDPEIVAREKAQKAQREAEAREEADARTRAAEERAEAERLAKELEAKRLEVERQFIDRVAASTWIDVQGASSESFGDELPDSLRTELENASRVAREIRTRILGMEARPLVVRGGRAYQLIDFNEDSTIELEDLEQKERWLASEIGWTRLARLAGFDPETAPEEELDRLASLALVTGTSGAAARPGTLTDVDERAERQRVSDLFSIAVHELRAVRALEKLKTLAKIDPDDPASRNERVRFELYRELLEVGPGTRCLKENYDVIMADVEALTWAADWDDRFRVPAAAEKDGRVRVDYDWSGPGFGDWDLGLIWTRTRDGLKSGRLARREDAVWSRPRFAPSRSWRVEVEYEEIENLTMFTLMAGRLLVEYDPQNQTARLAEEVWSGFSYHNVVETGEEPKYRTIARIDIKNANEDPGTSLEPGRHRLVVERTGASIRVTLRTADAEERELFNTRIPSRGLSWRVGVHSTRGNTVLRSAKIVAPVDRAWVVQDAVEEEWAERRLDAVQRSNRLRAMFPGAKLANANAKDPSRVKLEYDFESPIQRLDWQTHPSENWIREGGFRDWGWIEDRGGLTLTRPISDGNPTGDSGFIFPILSLAAGFDQFEKFQYRMQYPAGQPCAIGHFVRGGHQFFWDQRQHTWLTRGMNALSTRVARGSTSLSKSLGRRPFELPEEGDTLKVIHSEEIAEGAVQTITSVDGRKILSARDPSVASGTWVGFASVGTCVRLLEVEMVGTVNLRWLESAWSAYLLTDFIDERRRRALPFQPMIEDDSAHWEVFGTPWSIGTGKKGLSTADWPRSQSSARPHLVVYTPWLRLQPTWGLAYIQGDVWFKGRESSFGLVIGTRNTFEPYIRVRVESGEIVAQIIKDGTNETTVIEELARAAVPKAASRNKATWRLETDGRHYRVVLRDQLRLEFEIPKDWVGIDLPVGFTNPADAPPVQIKNLEIGPLQRW